jgi:hypothetical protein
MQLAAETLILREEMMRTRSDTKGMDAALAAAQADTRAARARAQACEEAFEPLMAELDTLKVAMMMTVDAAEIGAPPRRLCVPCTQRLSCLAFACTCMLRHAKHARRIAT